MALRSLIVDDNAGYLAAARALLEREGIASLFMKRQPYFDPPVADQRAAIGDFVASLSRETVR